MNRKEGNIPKTRKERSWGTKNERDKDRRRERERERERSGRKIEKHVRMDAAHIISAMLLESSLRLGDHP